MDNDHNCKEEQFCLAFSTKVELQFTIYHQIDDDRTQAVVVMFRAFQIPLNYFYSILSPSSFQRRNVHDIEKIRGRLQISFLQLHCQTFYAKSCKLM